MGDFREAAFLTFAQDWRADSIISAKSISTKSPRRQGPLRLCDTHLHFPVLSTGEFESIPLPPASAGGEEIPDKPSSRLQPDFSSQIYQLAEATKKARLKPAQR
ncbi:MAG: hypothetical protein ACI8P0_005306 [Planctomycetaceae bacterium]|jgi:hypothetical protein